MFFNYARFFPQQQQLDTLLTKNPDCDLETILSVDGILQEIKGVSSNKFADHIISHPDMYKQMIDYIIYFEDELIDKKTQILYPFYCSEILGSQNQKLLDYLFERPEDGIDADSEMIRVSLYDELIKFLENDVFNNTSAGYFAKAYLAIIKKRGYDVWTTLVNNKMILNNLIKHIDCKHIAEIIEKLIILDTTQEFISDQNFLNERKVLLERIIVLLQNKYYCSEIVDNICEILSEITSKNMSCLYYNSPEIIPFIDQIRRPDILFDIAVKTKRGSPFQVLINLVDMASKEQKKEEDDEVIHNIEKDYLIFENILPELPQQLLSNEYNIKSFINSNKEIVKPFGLYKMMLLRLIAILVQTNELSIINPLVDAGLIQALQNICIQFSSNNQIHILSEKIIKIILDQNEINLVEKVFKQGKLINFIVCYHIQDNITKGYIAMLTSLSNYLLQKAQNSEILSLLQEEENWLDFVRTRLNIINLKEKPFLCNVNPKQKQDPEVVEDEAINLILKKFTDSQHQHYAQKENKLQQNKEDKEEEQTQLEEKDDDDLQENQQQNQEEDEQLDQEEIEQNNLQQQNEELILDKEIEPFKNSNKQESEINVELQGCFNHINYWRVAQSQNIEQLLENYS